MSRTDQLTLVLDTNVVLDLFVYEDPATVPLRAALAEPQSRWLATPVMREELRRVLAYPQVVKRLEARSLTAEAVLAAFDARAQLADTAPKAPYTCKDADDQKFIDLAVAHTAVLLSKDKAVLCMAKRLATLGVSVNRQWAPAAIQPQPITP
ncbi:MAG: putative toxin-antitoxin system toxin component, PIN family [Gammaproteobacteria bacterium]|jgi:putative PIN family toxin of toxin-antitoxin system|uniref:putative toxin-antitoxin system toxin component, PIN family n=1 Tax=Hydrogenophaga sp. TaxID=1904254 RepID=UPI0025C27F98|nr:putative toxin-antitoxin system toxin component, PIN family [Hydrogenophaga sp.]MBU4183899.1 putative toxin-antitoxin system toxin component, PIN family [Gammaproteobacteria bacterium]MBU4279612.1 putative toxin-antitoxin system toxin component, PIN family [Gammaproteobacteria bacterium]MBU4324135.1 putative toxin-antitoxin system toxin component, PIN family [Gammaproteobacteria bacterium]MBU4507213.1 putative toxin-antitoxin system toxin component, PIN family [Gammaproteobacteria bacterium]